MAVKPIHQTPEQHARRPDNAAEAPPPSGKHHRQTGEATAGDARHEVSDPHPSDEEHPYDAKRPGGDAAPPTDVPKGRANIGHNPEAHDGTPRPRPRNVESGT